MDKIVGISDEVTVCGCCGKTGLKKTVVFDAGDHYVYMGTDCAGMVMLGTKTAKNTKIITTQAAAASYAQNLLKQYTVDQVIMAVWNRYGFGCEAKNGKFKIANFAEIEIC